MTSNLQSRKRNFLHNVPLKDPSDYSNIVFGTAANFFAKAVHGAKWQNFAAGLGTGATYITLHGLHWHPHWLTVIEIILFVVNIVIFCTNLVLISIHVLSNITKDMISHHLMDPTTPLFAPLLVLQYGSICVGTFLYAGNLGAKDLNSYEPLFWSYLALSILLCGSMTFIWFGWGRTGELRSFAMTGAFLVFPLMLVGTVAANTLRVIDPAGTNALAILSLGYAFQGLGMLVAFIFITLHFYRAIEYGFHRGAAAGSTFIAVGPPGFTALTILQLATYGRQIIPLHTPLPQQAADVIYYATIPVSLCLLGFALYCWAFAMFPYMLTFTKHILLNPGAAWPLTFPTVGFISTLAMLGAIFNSYAFYYLHAIFTGYVCLIYSILLPTWLYRQFVPPDPKVLAARAHFFEEAYDHTSFWSTIRMADEAERECNDSLKKKADAEDHDRDLTGIRV